MYVRQIIMLYTLNLHSAVCQLYLKLEKKTTPQKYTLSKNVHYRFPHRMWDIYMPYVHMKSQLCQEVVCALLSLKLWGIQRNMEDSPSLEGCNAVELGKQNLICRQEAIRTQGEGFCHPGLGCTG